MAEDGGDEPVSKKKKTVDDRLLKEFWKTDLCRGFLKPTAERLSNGTGPYPISACALKIVQADANMQVAFNNAHCEVVNHVFPSTDFCVAESFGNLFKTGIEILLDYLNGGIIPKDEQHLDSLSRLIAFLEKSDYDWLENTDEEEKENNWCIKIAQHFLSELSQSKEYIIANSYPYARGSDHSMGRTEERCPCSKKDKLHGGYGDTSFGCPSLWHGEVDLLLGMPVLFANEGCDEPDSVSESASNIGVEEKSGKDFSQQEKYQMRAQIINFAYVLRKKEKEKYGDKAANSLVPHIGISKEKFCLYFYDCVNDILLATDSFDLFQKLHKKIEHHVVILAWLALNYKVLGGKIPDRLLVFKSGFQEMFVPEVIRKYSEEVQQPCHVRPSLQKENVDYAVSVFWPDQHGT